MTDIASIPIKQGEQIWVLIRTDRDGASADEIASSIGGFMRFVLGNAATASTGLTDLPQVISTGDKEWRVGAARPIQLMSIDHERPDYPAGRTFAQREMYPGEGIPTVNGTKPWWVTLRFWWRAGETTVEWPTLIARVGSLTGLSLGDYTTDQADWVLDRAIQPTVPMKDPGDATWAEVQTKRAVEAAGSVAGTGVKVLSGVAILTVLALLIKVEVVEVVASSPIEMLDQCSTKLADAQRAVAKTRKVACVVSGLAVAGGFGLLVWKLFSKEEPQPPAEGTD